MEAYIADQVVTQQLEDPLYVVDLGVVTRLFHAWSTALPRVTPFYAVKSFTDKAVISMLAALGAGFDCASESEVCILVSICIALFPCRQASEGLPSAIQAGLK